MTKLPQIQAKIGEPEKLSFGYRVRYLARGPEHHQYRHGMNRTRPYNIWCGIKNRCRNSKWPAYKNYGGKGVTISDAWFESFVTFWQEMGPTYFDGATIDRIDNSKGYESGNCRWATIVEQARNKSNVHFYEHNGERLLAHEWDKKLGFREGTFHSRIYNGWTVERAVTTPKFNRRNP